MRESCRGSVSSESFSPRPKSQICSVNRSMTAFQIRPYRSADEDAVVALWVVCQLIGPKNNPRRDIARKLRVNPEWFLVGEVDGKIVATCMVGYEGHRG